MAHPQLNVKRIVIIGAGVSGLVCARALLAENCFHEIDVLEQRGESGGVWNYTPETDTTPVPSTDPHITEEPIIAGTSPVFVSAIYDELDVNIPKHLMCLEGFPFPSDLPLFPQHRAVREYLQEYSQDIRHLITFNAKVIDCQKQGNQWEVLFQDTRTGCVEEKRIYDAVVVAAGHYNIPYVPSLPGLKQWDLEYHGSISHSKYFRRPEFYSGKKVIVVGNAASGIDIAAQVCQFSKHPLLHSQRSRSPISTMSDPARICEVSEITSFSNLHRSIHFSDGRIEEDVDSIIFCTGYLHSLPFLPTLNAGPDALITDGMRVNRLYQHIFYIPDPTLSIIGLPMKVIPFRTSQAAAALIARVLANRVSLPSLATMRFWENREMEERGNGKKFHALDYPRDADYINLLASLCGKAAGEANGALKLKPPAFGDEERWTRARCAAIKKAYSDMKKKGVIVTRPEELGFDFKLEEDRLGITGAAAEMP